MKQNKDIEEFYDELYNMYRDNEFTYEYKNRNGIDAFAFWDGKSYHNSFTRKDGKGHKKLTVVCKACLYDENEEVRVAMRNLEFSSSYYSLCKGVFPCGCSKQRGKTLMQVHGIDDFIGSTKLWNGGVNTVKDCLGGLGNKRRYIVECSKCSLDKELWPYGSILTTKSNFKSKLRTNCGCNGKRVSWTESQVKVLVTRLCNKKGLSFLVWYEDKYLGIDATRLILECPYHGISDNTHTGKFLGQEGGCRPCAQELGKFGFYKTKSMEKDYLYLLKVYSDSEMFYKIGRSFDVPRRINQHKQHSPYEFELIGTYENVHNVVFKLEQKLLLDTIDFKYVPKVPWDGGYRECRTNLCLSSTEVIETFNL